MASDDASFATFLSKTVGDAERLRALRTALSAQSVGMWSNASGMLPLKRMLSDARAALTETRSPAGDDSSGRGESRGRQILALVEAPDGRLRLRDDSCAVRAVVLGLRPEMIGGVCLLRRWTFVPDRTTGAHHLEIDARAEEDACTLGWLPGHAPPDVPPPRAPFATPMAASSRGRSAHDAASVRWTLADVRRAEAGRASAGPVAGPTAARGRGASDEKRDGGRRRSDRRRRLEIGCLEAVVAAVSPIVRRGREAFFMAELRSPSEGGAPASAPLSSSGAAAQGATARCALPTRATAARLRRALPVALAPRAPTSRATGPSRRRVGHSRRSRRTRRARRADGAQDAAAVRPHGRPAPAVRSRCLASDLRARPLGVVVPPVVPAQRLASGAAVEGGFRLVVLPDRALGRRRSPASRRRGRTAPRRTRAEDRGGQRRGDRRAARTVCRRRAPARAPPRAAPRRVGRPRAAHRALHGHGDRAAVAAPRGARRPVRAAGHARVGQRRARGAGLRAGATVAVTHVHPIVAPLDAESRASACAWQASQVAPQPARRAVCSVRVRAQRRRLPRLLERLTFPGALWALRTAETLRAQFADDMRRRGHVCSPRSSALSLVESMAGPEARRARSGSPADGCERAAGLATPAGRCGAAEAPRPGQTRSPAAAAPSYSQVPHRRRSSPARRPTPSDATPSDDATSDDAPSDDAPSTRQRRSRRRSAVGKRDIPGHRPRRTGSGRLASNARSRAPKSAPRRPCRYKGLPARGNGDPARAPLQRFVTASADTSRKIR